MRQKIKVLIVDDHPVFRRGLREIIEENKQFEIVGEGGDGRAGLQLVAEKKPDILVLDVDMPKLNGIQMAREMRKKDPGRVQVVFLTMYSDEDIFNAAMKAGVKGYVLKENASQDIVAALLKVAKGETFDSSRLQIIGRQHEDGVRALLQSKPQLDSLTPAERRILKLIADDSTSKEISDLLGVSVKTVDNHRMNICNKLNIHGSHSLLKFAFDHKQYL